ncbi:hypothetical protein HMPREF9983_01868 [Staphylococcus epidermidis NIHLM023]|nr:hypothetical protein HMPREF9983_01868 [Staphylococcus epidermidis NIHLM023]
MTTRVTMQGYKNLGDGYHDNKSNNAGIHKSGRWLS